MDTPEFESDCAQPQHNGFADSQSISSDPPINDTFILARRLQTLINTVREANEIDNARIPLADFLAGLQLDDAEKEEKQSDHERLSLYSLIIRGLTDIVKESYLPQQETGMQTEGFRQEDKGTQTEGWIPGDLLARARKGGFEKTHMEGYRSSLKVGRATRSVEVNQGKKVNGVNEVDDPFASLPGFFKESRRKAGGGE